MRRITKVALGALVLLFVATASSCEDGSAGSSQSSESKRRQGSYDKLVAGQPAQTMDYSPSRDIINFWIETWGQEGKLSFVYLQGANGELLGYYVLEGRPVNLCASLTPSYEIVDRSNDPDVVVPAPGIDGTYYQGAGCDTYYGKDATTGAYLEYTAGLGINVLLFDEPMPRQDVEPLGPTSVEDIET